MSTCPNGATTFNRTKCNIMTLSITILLDGVYKFVIVILSVVMLSVAFFMVMLSVVTPSGVIVNVVAPP